MLASTRPSTLEPCITSRHNTETPLRSQTNTSSTPPSTPIFQSDQISTDVLANPTMFELTRQKLERAAQAQLSGRRGGGGLRELVLLSNMFGAASSSASTMSASTLSAEQEYEAEQRRKEDEERWLDGVLEEMLEQDEDGAEEEAYVSLTLRDDRHIGDSGYLEEYKPGELRALPSIQPLASSLDSILEEDQLLGEEEGDLLDSLTYQGSPPSSPPLPPRSPPIPVPQRRHDYPPIANAEAYSASPPLLPPALTPDSSPSGPGAAPEFLSTSFDSIKTDLADSWINDLTEQRLDLVALDLSSSVNNKDSFDFDAESKSYSSTNPASLDLAVRRVSRPLFSARGLPLSIKSCLDCIDFGTRSQAFLRNDEETSAAAAKSVTPRSSIAPQGRADSLALVLADPLGPRQVALWRSRSLSPETIKPSWSPLSGAE